MFLAHSFRLRDPWQCECGDNGTVRWSRVFHKPTGLEPDDALWLVCSGLPVDAAVAVNERSLDSSAEGKHQFEVTHLIADSNRIDIELPSNLQPPASSPQPYSAFPFDVRLGVVGHS